MYFCLFQGHLQQKFFVDSQKKGTAWQQNHQAALQSFGPGSTTRRRRDRHFLLPFAADFAAGLRAEFFALPGLGWLPFVIGLLLKTGARGDSK